MRRRRPSRGFSLVEVVVAVTLLGVGIAACVACMGSATRASAVAEENTAVQLMARELLTRIETGALASGEDQGDFGPERPGYAWQVQSQQSDVSGLLLVRARILWGDPEQPRSQEFVTYVRRR